MLIIITHITLNYDFCSEICFLFDYYLLACTHINMNCYSKSQLKFLYFFNHNCKLIKQKALINLTTIYIFDFESFKKN